MGKANIWIEEHLVSVIFLLCFIFALNYKCSMVKSQITLGNFLNLKQSDCSLKVTIMLKISMICEQKKYC